METHIRRDPCRAAAVLPLNRMLNLEAALTNVALLWLLTVPHEFAHAWTATRLGDDTPRRDGRVTLNPLAHVDWLGTVLLPALTSLFGGGFIGWGRAVNTNPHKLRGGLNGLALVALAGPASNVVFSVVLALAAVLLAGSLPDAAGFAIRGVTLSLYLALFNLLPHVVNGLSLGLLFGGVTLVVMFSGMPIAFSLGPVSPAELQAGSRVSVRYHPTGSTGQVADEVTVIAGQRSRGTRR